MNVYKPKSLHRHVNDIRLKKREPTTDACQGDCIKSLPIVEQVQIAEKYFRRHCESCYCRTVRVPPARIVTTDYECEPIQKTSRKIPNAPKRVIATKLHLLSDKHKDSYHVDSLNKQYEHHFGHDNSSSCAESDKSVSIEDWEYTRKRELYELHRRPHSSATSTIVSDVPMERSRAIELSQVDFDALAEFRKRHFFETHSTEAPGSMRMMCDGSFSSTKAQPSKRIQIPNKFDGPRSNIKIKCDPMELSADLPNDNVPSNDMSSKRSRFSNASFADRVKSAPCADDCQDDAKGSEKLMIQSQHKQMQQQIRKLPCQSLALKFQKMKV